MKAEKKSAKFINLCIFNAMCLIFFFKLNSLSKLFRNQIGSGVLFLILLLEEAIGNHIHSEGALILLGTRE